MDGMEDDGESLEDLLKRQIIVSGLPESFETVEGIESYFCQFGDISEVRLAGQGVADVIFANVDDAQLALDEVHFIDGCSVEVSAPLPSDEEDARWEGSQGSFAPQEDELPQESAPASGDEGSSPRQSQERAEGDGGSSAAERKAWGDARKGGSGGMPAVEPNKVFVSGLPKGAADEEVTEYFRSYGSVTAVKLKRDDAGQIRGSGFITFAAEEDVIAVLKDYDKHVLQGRHFECLACGSFGVTHFGPIKKDQLFVCGLPHGTTQQMLEEHFRPFGEVANVQVKHEKGIAFVTFSSCSAVQLALHSYNSHSISGQWVGVQPVFTCLGKGDGKKDAVGGGSSWSGAGRRSSKQDDRCDWVSPRSSRDSAPAKTELWAPWRNNRSSHSAVSSDRRSSWPSSGREAERGKGHDTAPRGNAALTTGRDQKPSVDRYRVFVGGLPATVTEADVFEHFSRYGRVTKITMRNGFCYVKFEDEEHVRAVLKYYYLHKIADKWVECQACGHFGLPRATLLKDRIFVGGLPRDSVTQDSLEQHFSKYGTIKEVDLKRDRGFAFVIFTSCASVQLALHDYDLHVVNGKWVEVKPAADTSQTGSGENGASKSTSGGDRSNAWRRTDSVIAVVPGASSSWVPPAHAPTARTVASQVTGTAGDSGGIKGGKRDWESQWNSGKADKGRQKGWTQSSWAGQDSDRGTSGNEWGKSSWSKQDWSKSSWVAEPHKHARKDWSQGGGDKAKSVVDVNAKPMVDVNCVYIAGLPRAIKDQEVVEYFQDYGKVTDVNVKRDESGLHRGYCFVSFASPKQVQAVLKDYDRHKLQGKWIECMACGKFGLSNFGGAKLDKEKIFVGGLPPSATAETLEHHFSQFGRVTRAEVKREKGFGFVSFGSGADVQLALHAYNDHTLNGKWIEVKPVLLGRGDDGSAQGGGRDHSVSSVGVCASGSSGTSSRVSTSFRGGAASNWGDNDRSGGDGSNYQPSRQGHQGSWRSRPY